MARPTRTIPSPAGGDRPGQIDAPEVRAGDAVEGLADTVAVVAGRGHPIVLNSWVLNYLSDAQRRAYVAELDRLGASGDLSWIYAEMPALVSRPPRSRRRRTRASHRCHVGALARRRPHRGSPRRRPSPRRMDALASHLEHDPAAHGTRQRHGSSTPTLIPTRGPMRGASGGATPSSPIHTGAAPAHRSSPSWRRSSPNAWHSLPGPSVSDRSASAGPPGPHLVDAGDRRDGPQQHRLTIAGRTGHDVGAVVHAVGEVDVEHCRPGRTSSRCAASGRGTHGSPGRAPCRPRPPRCAPRRRRRRAAC